MFKLKTNKKHILSQGQDKPDQVSFTRSLQLLSWLIQDGWDNSKERERLF